MASPLSPGPAPPLAVPAAVARRVPHLAAFFPETRLLPVAAAPAGAAALVLEGVGPAPRPAGALLAAEALWQAPRFGRRQAPVALLAAWHPDAAADPLRRVLAAAERTADAGAGRVAMALLREARVGGAPGLPDPGAAGLGLPRGGAALVLDPGLAPGHDHGHDPGHDHGHDHGLGHEPASPAAAARAMLAAARAEAGDGAVLVALAPDAPPGARPALPALPGIRRLEGRLAPWTLLDCAAVVHGIGTDRTELLALAAGLPLRSPAPWAARPAEAVFAALAAATRCADPFRARPWSLAAAIGQLADWRLAEAEHRRIVACTGIEWFKLARLRAALAHQGGAPRIRTRGSAAIRLARREGGAVGVWAATMPASLPARCAAAGVPLVQIEDGFVRSAGLGVLLAPAASLVLDGAGMHYDPATPSALERLLATADMPPALLARAAALRRALIAGGITKYNLAGAPPDLGLPRGRRAVLVAGQVEDDAAMRRGGAAIRGNLALLRAVRAAEPEALILFKPHPDVESGIRRGAVPAAEAARLADRVLSGVPIGPLYDQVEAVHSIASLAGFEALLRGRRVVAWGRPFYAGWGLTEDRDPPPPAAALPGARRRRWQRGGAGLTLDALVAAALILYPRYRDPLTGLPCPPELLLERLGAARPAGSGFGLPAPLRAFVAGTSRRLAGWWAAR